MRVALFLLLLAAAVIVPAATGQQNTPVIPAKTALAWNVVTTRIDGSVVTDLAGYEVALSDSGADLNTSGVPLATDRVAADACGGTRCRLPLATLTTGLPDSSYRVWVRSVDLAGNASMWAGPVAVETDSEAPPMPTGLKIEVLVTVGR